MTAKMLTTGQYGLAVHAFLSRGPRREQGIQKHDPPGQQQETGITLDQIKVAAPASDRRCPAQRLLHNTRGEMMQTVLLNWNDTSLSNVLCFVGDLSRTFRGTLLLYLGLSTAH